jgi:hypothetical protein
MKTQFIKIISVIMLFMWFIESKAQNDLPPPSPNIQSIPINSWVIAMDNQYQGYNGGTTVMNIKAYGLAVELLWNNIPLRWIIKTGKLKDQPDLTTTAQLIIPSVGLALTDSFKAGPLVIFPQDTATARTVITAFNNKISGTTNDIKIYKITTSGVTADIRHTLTHKPLIGVYDDGGNASIHTDFLKNALVDTSRYRVIHPGFVLDSASCYTLASSPHWSVSSYNSADSLRLLNLKKFLNSGGNFVAECDALNAVENFPPVRFMTTGGVTTINANVTTQLYTNVDMPVMQFHGAFTEGGGSVVNYLVNKTTSNWTNTMYIGNYFLRDVIRANGTTGTDGILDTVVQVNVCKISTGIDGGNIIYLGGHTYDGVTSLADVNGERIFLNAMLLPAHRNLSTGILPTPYSICQGDSIKIEFTPPSGTGFTFQWSGPNSYSSTVEDPIILNAQTVKAGIYTLQIISNIGCRFNYYTTVNVPLKPVFTASTTQAVVCEGDSCTISVSPTAGLTSVNWYLKDSTKSGCKPTGSSLYTTYSQTIQPTVSGTYVAIAFNASGCKDTSCVTVTVDKLPVLTSPFPTSGPLCYGRGSRATITPGYGGTGCTETYQWRMDGGAWQTYTSGATIAATARDSVEIRATRSCTSGCVNKIVRLKWNVTAPQVVSATNTLQQCINEVNGYIAYLDATNPSPSTGVWSIVSGPGNINSPTSTNTTIGSLSTTGVTTKVRWVVTNSYNCKDTANVSVTPPFLDSSLISKYSNEYCLTCPVLNGNVLSYYDFNGKLLARVTDIVDAVSIGNTTFCGQLPYNVSGNPAASDVSTVPAYIEGAGFVQQPYLPRAWNFNTTTDAPMTVNLYFTDGELAALTGKSQQDGGYFDFGGDPTRLLLVAYPNNSDTFIPAGSPNGVVYNPIITRIGSNWQVTFDIALASTIYLYPPYWAANYGLPVELLKFTASPLVSSIQLDWSTASEKDNEKFEIERREEKAEKYIKIDEVKGSNYSSSLKTYSFEDKNVIPGILYYYRLKQVDYSKQFTYSNIISAILTFDDKYSVGEFSPNPSKDKAIVKVLSPTILDIDISVYNYSGTLLYQNQQTLNSGISEVNIDVKNLYNGIYIVIINSDKGSWSRKIIKKE